MPKESKESKEAKESKEKETKEGSPKPKKKVTPKKKSDKPAASKRVPATVEPRKRKVVQRFTESPAAPKEKEIVIKKGKGKKLENCENVATQINKRKRSDELLQTLYGILFGRVTKKSPIKDHLLEFSGVVYEDDDAKKGREKLEARLERFHVGTLKELLMFFGQDPAGKKEEVVDHLADFLEKPAPSDEVYETKKEKEKFEHFTIQIKK